MFLLAVLFSLEIKFINRKLAKAHLVDFNNFLEITNRKFEVVSGHSCSSSSEESFFIFWIDGNRIVGGGDGLVVFLNLWIDQAQVQVSREFQRTELARNFFKLFTVVLNNKVNSFSNSFISTFVS